MMTSLPQQSSGFDADRQSATLGDRSDDELIGPRTLPTTRSTFPVNDRDDVEVIGGNGCTVESRDESSLLKHGGGAAHGLKSSRSENVSFALSHGPMTSPSEPIMSQKPVNVNNHKIIEQGDKEY